MLFDLLQEKKMGTRYFRFVWLHITHSYKMGVLSNIFRVSQLVA